MYIFEQLNILHRLSHDINSPGYSDNAIGIQLYCSLLNLLSYIYFLPIKKDKIVQCDYIG